jgi:hypothetical protein
MRCMGRDRDPSSARVDTVGEAQPLELASKSGGVTTWSCRWKGKTGWRFDHCEFNYWARVHRFTIDQDRSRSTKPTPKSRSGVDTWRCMLQLRQALTCREAVCRLCRADRGPLLHGCHWRSCHPCTRSVSHQEVGSAIHTDRREHVKLLSIPVRLMVGRAWGVACAECESGVMIE